MDKQNSFKNKIILILIVLLGGFGVAVLFAWWWNPKLIDPISTEEMGMLASIDRPIGPELEMKLAINVEECKRGDKRYTNHGFGYKAAIVLMGSGSKCVLKEYVEIEGLESVHICSVPKSLKEYNIYTRPILDTIDGGFCKRLPPVFKKFW